MGTATTPGGAASGLDGRTARKIENRNRILDAALDLAARMSEPDIEVIAEAAGVSVRSVYNHFPTARHLVAGMYERGSEKLRPLLDDLPGPEVPFDERVTRWVRVWGRVQEEIAPIRWRALIVEDEHPELQPELDALRRRHRGEIDRIFPEITSKEAKRIVLSITDSLTWRAMRKHQGLTVDQACAVIGETIRAARQR